MALPTVTAAVFAESISKTFVKFYYDLLQNRPQLLHCMYEESSNLSLPDANGVMVSVTTPEAINDVFLSCDYYKGCVVNYETVDSQMSQNDGISILVTGCLTGPEKFKRKFCQTFFLASKEDGVKGDEVKYIIQNDMFRFVDKSQPKKLKEDMKRAAVVIKDYEGGGTPTNPSVGVPENGEEVHCTSETGNAVGEQKLSDVPASKTYASILKGRTLPSPVYMTESKEPLDVSTNPLGVSTNPISDVGDHPVKTLGISTNPPSDVGGHSVYVSNLPLNATINLLKMELTKFGRIVPGGVQVRWNQTGRFCYGFVEFEEQKSMRDALMASPVTIAGRYVNIQKKTTPVRVRNGIVIGSRPNQFPPRSGTRNEISRSKGDFFHNFGSERGNFSAPGRFQDFQPHGFQNRMQPQFANNGDVRMGQQGFFQNGNGRMGQVHAFQYGDGMVDGPPRMYM